MDAVRALGEGWSDAQAALVTTGSCVDPETGRDKRFRLLPFLVNLLLVALGVMVFVSRAQNFDLRLWVGVFLAVIGLGLIVYGYFVQKQKA